MTERLYYHESFQREFDALALSAEPGRVPDAGTLEAVFERALALLGD